MNQNFIEQEHQQTNLDHVQRTRLTGKQQAKQQTPTASKLADYNKQLSNRNWTDYNREWRLHLYTNSKQEDKLLNIPLARSLVLTF
jgi:hypothetical protein